MDNAFQGYNACIFAYGQTGENLIKLPILPIELSIFVSQTMDIQFMVLKQKLLPYVTSVNEARLTYPSGNNFCCFTSFKQAISNLLL